MPGARARRVRRKLGAGRGMGARDKRTERRGARGRAKYAEACAVQLEWASDKSAYQVTAVKTAQPADGAVCQTERPDTRKPRAFSFQQDMSIID